MQNNSSQPKNEKSTARETRPTLVEKMAMLEWIHAGVSRCVFVFAAVSWPINQSIEQSNYHWLKNAAKIYFRNFTNSFYLAKRNAFDVRCFMKWLFQDLRVENKRKEMLLMLRASRSGYLRIYARRIKEKK